ncbi:unnamed protein product, partial [Amoebophrya sp. A120]
VFVRPHKKCTHDSYVLMKTGINLSNYTTIPEELLEQVAAASQEFGKKNDIFLHQKNCVGSLAQGVCVRPHFSRRIQKWRELDQFYITGCDVPNVAVCSTIQSPLGLDHRHKYLRLWVEFAYQRRNVMRKKKDDNSSEQPPAPLWRATPGARHQFSRAVVDLLCPEPQQTNADAAADAEAPGSAGQLENDDAANLPLDLPLSSIPEALVRAQGILKSSAEEELRRYNKSHNYKVRQRLDLRVRILRKTIRKFSAALSPDDESANLNYQNACQQLSAVLEERAAFLETQKSAFNTDYHVRCQRTLKKNLQKGAAFDPKDAAEHFQKVSVAPGVPNADLIRSAVQPLDDEGRKLLLREFTAEECRGAAMRRKNSLQVDLFGDSVALWKALNHEAWTVIARILNHHRATNFADIDVKDSDDKILAASVR